jgi:hypothetical protein
MTPSEQQLHIEFLFEGLQQAAKGLGYMVAPIPSNEETTLSVVAIPWEDSKSSLDMLLDAVKCVTRAQKVPSMWDYNAPKDYPHERTNYLFYTPEGITVDFSVVRR